METVKSQFCNYGKGINPQIQMHIIIQLFPSQKQDGKAE